MKDIELLKMHQQFGIDEIIGEEPVNRLQQSITKPQINAPQNVINENYIGISSNQAIARLAAKQFTNNIMSESQPLTSIKQTIEQVRKQVDKIDNLTDLEKAVRAFEGCNIKKMANNTVFCDGDPKSPIMIIGEAPGNNEDLQGIPFCGDSGKLLNEMFASIGLKRENLYITNTLFWRPPGNRKPTNDEMAMCKPFVEKHIALINPKLIILTGSTAMTGVLGINDAISRVRGRFINYNNCYLDHEIPTLTIFHPSYLMRQPGKKRLAWQDLLTIKDFLKL